MSRHVNQLVALADATGRFEKATAAQFMEIAAYPVALVWSRPATATPQNAGTPCDTYRLSGTYDVFVFGERADPATHAEDWAAVLAAAVADGFRFTDLDEATPASVVEDEVLVTTLTFTRDYLLTIS